MTVNGATCRDGTATRRWFARLSLWDVPSGSSGCAYFCVSQMSDKEGTDRKTYPIGL